MTAREPTLISGAMPKLSRWFYTVAFASACVMFLVIGGIGMRVLVAATNGSRAIAASLFMTISAGLIALQIREYRRFVREYSYDGWQLRFRTLGSQMEEDWRLSEFKELRELRRRNGLGYRLKLKDGRVVYLYNTVSNLNALVMALQADLARGF